MVQQTCPHLPLLGRSLGSLRPRGKAYAFNKVGRSRITRSPASLWLPGRWAPQMQSLTHLGRGVAAGQHQGHALPQRWPSAGGMGGGTVGPQAGGKGPSSFVRCEYSSPRSKVQKTPPSAGEAQKPHRYFEFCTNFLYTVFSQNTRPLEFYSLLLTEH